MLITICITLIVVGLVLAAINRWVPMDGNIKSILNAVVICYTIYWVLKITGLLAKFGSF